MVVRFPGLGLEITLNHVAFRLFGLEVYWYGILIGLGLALAILFACRHLREFGIDADRFFDVVMIGAIAGVIGSRLYYVAFAPPGVITSIGDIFNLRQGGLAFYGAVIFGVGFGILACRLRKVKVLPTIDLAGIGFLIGQCIGRWGNFVNQEAFGTNTDLPWGMISQETMRYLAGQSAELAEKGIYVNANMPVHPTFLYESLWCLLGFLVLRIYMKHRKFDGELFLMYIAWNGLGRAFIEGLRTDSLYLGDTSIRVSQLLAMLGVIAAVAVILYVRNKIRKAEDPAYLKPYGKTEAAALDLAAFEAERQAVAAARTARKAKTVVDTEREDEPVKQEIDVEVSDRKADEEPSETLVGEIEEPETAEAELTVAESVETPAAEIEEEKPRKSKKSEVVSKQVEEAALDIVEETDAEITDETEESSIAVANATGQIADALTGEEATEAETETDEAEEMPAVTDSDISEEAMEESTELTETEEDETDAIECKVPDATEMELEEVVESVEPVETEKHEADAVESNTSGTAEAELTVAEMEPEEAIEPIEPEAEAQEAQSAIEIEGEKAFPKKNGKKTKKSGQNNHGDERSDS